MDGAARPMDGPPIFKGEQMKNIMLGLVFLISVVTFAAEKKISDLNALGHSSWASGDLFPIVDVSAGETKKTTVADFDGRYQTIGNYITALTGDVTGSGPGSATVTIANLARTKLANGTANQVLINDGSGVISSEAQLAISRGGTGAGTANAGLNALLPSQASNALKVLQTDGTNTSWVTNVAASGFDSSNGIAVNMGLSTSVSTNILTIALKQKDGSTDPSTGGAKVTFAFHNTAVPSTSRSYTTVDVTSALSIAAPNGATLGLANNVASYIWVYAVNNGGTVDLCVMGGNPIEDNTVASSSTIGAGSTSAGVLYCNGSYTNKTVRLIGRILETQTVAGAYASTVSEVFLLPVPKYKRGPITVTSGAISATSAYVFTIPSQSIVAPNVYSNNSNLFTTSASIAPGTTLNASGTGSPSLTGAFTFTLPTAVSLTAGVTYTNNGNTYVVTENTTSSTTMHASGPASPAVSGAYTFAGLTAASIASGTVYSNNGQTFTVTVSTTSSTTLTCIGTGAPSVGSTLVYVSGPTTGNRTYTGTPATTGGLVYVSGSPTNNLSFTADAAIGLLTYVSGPTPGNVAFTADTITGVPVINAAGANNLSYQEVGSKLSMDWRVQTSIAGTVGSGAYVLYLPVSQTMDTSVVTFPLPADLPTISLMGLGASMLGYGVISNVSAAGGTPAGPINAGAYSPNQIFFFVPSINSGGSTAQPALTPWASNVNALNNTKVYLSIHMDVPINGWFDYGP